MNELDELLLELKENGFAVVHPMEVKKIDKEHKYLVPILLKYLKNSENADMKSFITRCLGVKGFTAATKTLLEEFYKTSSDFDLKWTIGNTFSIIQDKNAEDEIIKIVKDKKHGSERQMFVVTLGKIKSEKAIPVLIKLLQDDDVCGHAIMALSNFKDEKLIPHIEPFLTHEKTWIRKKAEKAIKRITKNNKKRDGASK